MTGKRSWQVRWFELTSTAVQYFEVGSDAEVLSRSVLPLSSLAAFRPHETDLIRLDLQLQALATPAAHQLHTSRTPAATPLANPSTCNGRPHRITASPPPPSPHTLHWTLHCARPLYPQHGAVLTSRPTHTLTRTHTHTHTHTRTHAHAHTHTHTHRERCAHHRTARCSRSSSTLTTVASCGCATCRLSSRATSPASRPRRGQSPQVDPTPAYRHRTPTAPHPARPWGLVRLARY